MRRREVLAGLGAAGTLALAGCGCESWPGVGYVVRPQTVETSGDEVVVEATIRVEFNFGSEGTGIHNAALAAFDEEGAVLASESLGSITWENVPEAAREETDCGDHGTFEGNGSVTTGTVPTWVGIRYDRITERITESRRIARLRESAPEQPSADDYQLVDPETVTPPSEQPPVREPLEAISFSRGEVTCERIDQPEKRVQAPEVTVSFARSLPASNYRPVLAGYEYADTIRVDVGLAGRPQLRRLDCSNAAYEVALTVAENEWEPTPVDLRHLDTGGAVVESYRT